MRIHFSNLLPLVLLVLLAALTLWLRITIESPAPAEPGNRRHDPDAIIDNFTITRLNESGYAHYHLSARRMIHYPDDETAELVLPRFVKRDDGPTVTITADRGRMLKNEDEAFFYGNVLLVREPYEDSEELRARTEFIHVLAEQDIARTDRRVTVTQGKSTLTGVGMEVNKDSEKFALFSNVKGSFDARKKN